MNAIHKQKDVNMVKVGEKVVLTVNVHGYADLALNVHTVTFVDHGVIVINNEFYFKQDEIRHATPEEITAGMNQT